jgi:hypothetical protein
MDIGVFLGTQRWAEPIGNLSVSQNVILNGRCALQTHGRDCGFKSSGESTTCFPLQLLLCSGLPPVETAGGVAVVQRRKQLVARIDGQIYRLRHTQIVAVEQPNVEFWERRESSNTALAKQGGDAEATDRCTGDSRSRLPLENSAPLSSDLPVLSLNFGACVLRCWLHQPDKEGLDTADVGSPEKHAGEHNSKTNQVEEAKALRLVVSSLTTALSGSHQRGSSCQKTKADATARMNTKDGPRLRSRKRPRITLAAPSGNVPLDESCKLETLNNSLAHSRADWSKFTSVVHGLNEGTLSATDASRLLPECMSKLLNITLNQADANNAQKYSESQRCLQSRYDAHHSNLSQVLQQLFPKDFRKRSDDDAGGRSQLCASVDEEMRKLKQLDQARIRVMLDHATRIS